MRELELTGRRREVSRLVWCIPTRPRRMQACKRTTKLFRLARKTSRAKTFSCHSHVTSKAIACRLQLSGIEKQFRPPCCSALRNGSSIGSTREKTQRRNRKPYARRG